MALLKKVVIRLAAASGLTMLSQRRLARRYPAGFIRAVNYHGTPAALADKLERHFRYFSEHYVAVGPAELAAMLSGDWRAARPGIIVAFDDGLRSNFTTAEALLNHHGLTGWFFLPAGVIEAAEAPGCDQRALAAAHSIRIPAGGDGKVFMTWEEARLLARRHVVGCHTLSHRRLPPGTDETTLRNETDWAKRLMEERLGRAVDSFCWVGGEEENFSREAAAAITAAGFRYAFMSMNAPIVAATHPLHLHRTRLDPTWPLAWVDFYQSGLLDAARARARRRVDAVTA